MTTCIQCGNEQATGKFCAKCGSPMPSEENVSPNLTKTINEEPQVATTQSSQEPPVQPQQTATPNPNVEQVKKTAQNYANSFVGLLKKPTTASTEESMFTNGIISFILLNLLLGLATTALVNKFFSSILGLLGGFFGYGDEKVLSAKYIFIFAIIYVLLGLVTIVTVYVVNKLFVAERSFKSVLVSITNFYPLAIVITAFAYLVTLIDLKTFALYVLILALTVVLTLAPLFVIGRDMEGKNTKFDKFYVYLIVCVVISILSYFVTDIAVTQLIESFTPDPDDIFDEMW